MLQLPRKISSDVDLVGPLRNYLKSEANRGGGGGVWSSIFGSGKESSSIEKHEDSLAQFNDLRKRATSSSSSASVVMKNLAKYFEQISYAESKFPVGDSIRVKFSWNNAFSEKKKKRSLNTLSEEKICVLFNMGCVHTELAIEADADALQEKARHFRLAAGIFAATRGFVTGEDMSKMSDLHTETLEMCEAIAIASAQTCFYEKAVKAKMSPKTLCKLAMGCKSLFEDAISKAESTKIETKSHWISILKVQRYSFEAAAYYWRAQVEHDEAREIGTGYGIEVARLVEALNILDKTEEGSTTKYKGEDDVMASVDNLRKKIKEMHETSETDNNSVYMESVPDADALKTIEAKVLVKPIVFDVLNELGTKENGEDLFRSIVPSVVTEASVEFKSILEKRVEEMKTIVRESNDMAKGTLASLGLPAALEAEDSGQTIPDSTRARLSAIRMTSGGIEGLENKLSSLNKMVQQAEASLRRVRENLNKEASMDSQCRSKYGSRWTRTRSDVASKQLSSDLRMYEGKINGGRMASDSTRERIRSSTNALRFLSKSDSELNAMFPAQNRQRAGSTRERLELKRLLLDVSKMIDERTKKLSKLEEDARKIDIVSVMSKEGALKASAKGTIIRDKDTIFATELSKFDEITNFLKESAGEKQKDLIEQIVSTNQAYRKTRDVSEATSKREKVLQNIQIALAESEEISEHIREGQAFFQGLNEMIRVFEGRVSDFYLSRKRDMEERSADIEEEKAFVTTVPVGPSNNVLDAIPVSSLNSPYQQQHQQVSAPPMAPTYGMYGSSNNVAPPPEPVRSPKKMPPPPSYGGYDDSTSTSSFNAPPYTSSTYGSSSSSSSSSSAYGTKTSSNSNDEYGSSTYGRSGTYGSVTTAPSYGSTGSNQTTMPPPPPSYDSMTTAAPHGGPYRSTNNDNYVPEPVRAYPPTYGGTFDAPTTTPPKYGATTSSSSRTTTSSLPAYGSSRYSQYDSSSSYSSELSKLQGMGFDRDQSMRALQKHNGDVDKAVNELLGM